MTSQKIFLSGATVGIVGGGQLGRMLVIAAKRMGYRTHIYSPESGSPAEQVADATTVADYEDATALDRFVAQVDVVTFEFENIPFESLKRLENAKPVRPAPLILQIAQNREREKKYLQKNGFPVVPFAVIQGASTVAEALRQVGLPALLKTAGFGYDGKGQHKVTDITQAEKVVRASSQDWVLEKWHEFEKEVSVLVARGMDGHMAEWGVVENRHRHHILDVSFAPADVSPSTGEELIKIARAIAESLSLVGLLCVEFFIGPDGQLLVNEIAPRPHNSGHWTIEGAVTSQFEQQVRAVCGLPLGATDLKGPSAMVNVLGDVWAAGEPDWDELSKHTDVKWHSYGKREPLPGRKMGHLTALGKTTGQAVERALAARQSLHVSTVK